MRKPLMRQMTLLAWLLSGASLIVAPVALADASPDTSAGASTSPSASRTSTGASTSALTDPATGPATGSHTREAYSEKAYATVMEDARFAITEYNFRIIETLDIGDAIRNRGSTDFPNHAVILFCNITLAEQALSISSHFIDHCPYRLGISDTHRGVRVSISWLPEHQRPPPLQALNKKINTLLGKILDYATSTEPFLL